VLEAYRRDTSGPSQGPPWMGGATADSALEELFIDLIWATHHDEARLGAWVANRGRQPLEGREVCEKLPSADERELLGRGIRPVPYQWRRGCWSGLNDELEIVEVPAPDHAEFERRLEDDLTKVAEAPKAEGLPEPPAKTPAPREKGLPQSPRYRRFTGRWRHSGAFENAWDEP